MPTYEYACRDCGEHLEVVQSFKDAPLTECGRCGGTLRKVFSAAGIIFKGSGYYVTDSRTKATKPSSEDPAAKKSSAAGADSGGTDSGGTDSGRSDSGGSDSGGSESGGSTTDSAKSA